MKTIVKEIAACLLMGLVVPGAFLEAGSKLMEKKQAQEPVATLVETVPEATEETVPRERIPVLTPDGSTREMDLEEYLVGVVLGEMPASFEPEALKAQAVAARTYAAKVHLQGDKHGGSICTDAACCQAYLPEESYLQKDGSREAVDKVRSAVLATAGEVLTYEGSLIEATYFSCSGGTTEDAVAVWGRDYPYLRAVTSPGEEKAETFEETTRYSREKLEQLLEVTLGEDPAEWIGTIRRTPGNGVETIEIGGKTFRGTELRTLLGLRSTAFTAESGEQGLLITTRGYGHRVGLSQYGADAMAATGKTYREILAHYYGGTELMQYADVKNSQTEGEDSQN